jgi:chitinase
MNPLDEELYREFTALKSPGLGTWIAIGGGDFSKDLTLTACSDMASISERRAVFIASVFIFLDKWVFQDVDID